MRDSVRLGRVAGVRVGLNWSLLIVAVLLGIGLADSNLPSNAPGYDGWAYGVAASLTAIAFLAAILAHELGHAVVARRQGLAVDGITLWALGGMTRIEGEAASPAGELRISGIGPLVSLVLGLGLGGLGLALGALGWSPLVVTALDWLGAINLILAVFNVLPGAPLDGGRLLHAALWRHHGDQLRATETVSRAGWILGLSMVALGFVGFAFAELWSAVAGAGRLVLDDRLPSRAEPGTVAARARRPQGCGPDDPRSGARAWLVDRAVLHGGLRVRPSSRCVPP